MATNIERAFILTAWEASKHPLDLAVARKLGRGLSAADAIIAATLTKKSRAALIAGAGRARKRLMPLVRFARELVDELAELRTNQPYANLQKVPPDVTTAAADLGKARDRSIDEQDRQHLLLRARNMVKLANGHVEAYAPAVKRGRPQSDETTILFLARQFHLTAGEVSEIIFPPGSEILLARKSETDSTIVSPGNSHRIANARSSLAGRLRTAKSRNSRR